MQASAYLTLFLYFLLLLQGTVTAFTGQISKKHYISVPRLSEKSVHVPSLRKVRTFPTFNSNKGDQGGEDLDEVAKKQGLEVAMFKSVISKDSSAVKPADLLKKYGIAYLATSISLSLVSFSICYILVSQGIDVPALMKNIGIDAGDTATNAGTVGIAYAVHKAASPIRFPPTVALTPVVAGWIGKEVKEESGSQTSE